LTLYVAALMVPFVYAPILDTDEAEFMAAAAYLHFHGDSALAWPNHTYVVAAFKGLADWIGPYDLFPLRVVNLIVAASVTSLVYWWVAGATSRWIALFCGAFLIISGMVHNACLVSREWPCALALVGGAYFFLLSQAAGGNRRRWLIFAAGLSTGLALFFKEQAAYITQAIPLWLLIQAVAERRWRSRLAEGLAYAAGGLTAGLLYFTPLALNGALQSHLMAELEFGSAYAYANAAGHLAPETTSWIHQFFIDRQNPAFILVAYFACLSQSPRLALRLWRGDHENLPAAAQVGDDQDHQTILLLSCYLLTSMAAVAMGSRFFSGYFLLWLPFIALTGGYGLKLLLLDSPAWVKWMNWIPVVSVALKFPEIVMSIETMLVPLMILAVAIALRRNRPLSWRIGRASRWILAVLLISLQCCYAWMSTSELRVAQVIWSVSRPSEMTRAFFRERAQPFDRMFVWGADPAFYCVTGLEPATRFVSCGGSAFLGDFFQPTGISPAWSAELFAALNAEPPRFVAVGPTRGDSQRMSGKLYFLTEFPALAEWLETKYQRVATLDDCDVYERR
jgi:hypothetical protein